ncbi:MULTISPECIES: GNAT family N-acetyltransferase [Myroides]|uniref:GNAT family N-acetyltransferase n=1 Tax=Myroides albus TaxID=2562892 RepID=A0A6I3LLX2_9FLAO|nr:MULTISPECIES: GNAT family N-acetyltransferase [Myroides]MTG98864.1 GNAT family N-acetyltransferase [Myroides albus]MVX37122.1 GNAT family N-acetyltransferase [Myroides sp. LoEW2-1]UVD79578.1 GNAT family N-acetyltransferase [Myroides albus]
MIRTATLADIQSILLLYRELFKQMAIYEPNYMKETDQDYEFVKSVINQENNFLIYVFEKDTQVEGFVIVQKQDAPMYNCFVQQKLVYIMDIVVNPDSRGLGIGKALLQQVKSWAKSQGVNYLELNVLTANTAAQKLYEREGFTNFNQSMRQRLD